MSRNKPNPVIVDFIAIYRSEPCLWQVKSQDYHNRTKKDAAYAKLAQKLDEIEPGADKKSVINKINSLRSAFRKEKKKVEGSYKSGTSTDSIYKPILWYYDLFDFLQDQDISRTSISNLDGESDEESIDNALPMKESGKADGDMSTEVGEEVSTTKSKQPITSRPGGNKRQKKNEDLTTETLLTVRDHFKAPKEQLDRFDLLGKTIALKLRGLEKRQALIAEKKIGDILFEAEMGFLNTSPTDHYSSSASQSPHNTTPCPTPSPTYEQGSCTLLASPNVTPCPTPSPTYGQGSFTQIHYDRSRHFIPSRDNTASTYFSQFDAN